MKSAIFATLVLLAGCGGYYRDPGYPTQPGTPSELYPDAFAIDANAGVEADPNTYGITTSRDIWRLTWLGDRYSHSFTGTITCSANCQIYSARFVNANPYDSVTVDRNQISFDAMTDSLPQTLDVQLSEPEVTFDLFEDGQEAIGAVVFQSFGVRSTTDVMPFTLVSSIGGRTAEQKTKLAPQFISQLPKGSTETAMIQPPGQGSTAASSGAAAK